MATIDYVESWAQRLRGRLYAQFRNATTWQKWCDEILGPQFQDLEDATQSLLSLLDIDNSVGAQLDMIGRYVGQPRLGLLDVTYRLYLRARVLANKSTGTVEEIFAIMRALYGASAGPRYLPGYVKQFAIRITKTLTRTEALVGVSFLGSSKEAGARGLLEWRETDSASVFTFDGTGSPAGLGFDVGYFAGAKQA